jgi:ferredoxin like protein
MSVRKVEESLAVNKYDIDQEVHVTVDAAVCASCSHYACTYACPAGCYKLTDGRMVFSFEGCLECGSCRIVCDRRAVKWALPRAGFGIMYEFG